jgi:putative oxidoreductase
LKAPLSRPDWKTVFFTLLRISCGAILIYASQDKLGYAEKFSGIVKEYHILPASLVPLAAVVVPWLEFFTGICLALGFKWRGAALLFCGLMGLYTLALSWNLLNGVEMNCGCFSMDSTDKITWWTILRDTGFFGMGLIVLTSPATYASWDRLNAQKDAQ